MKNNPLVSVIMPVFNSDKFVSLALGSILSQTYRHFEFIIVDDGSTDQTYKIIKSYAKHDKRIILILNKKNEGTTKSLNKAIKIAKGKYIVRMDADDWSYPVRFKKQVQLMENNPRVIVSGSYVEICDSDLNTSYLRKYHLTDAEIRQRIFRYSPFAHPVTIWKAAILKKEKYQESFKVGQDYELYFRIGKYGEFMNLAEPLLKLRLHKMSNSATMNNLQSKLTIDIRNKAVLNYNYHMTIFDKIYNLLQALLIGFIPVHARFKIFNFLRKFELY